MINYIFEILDYWFQDLDFKRWFEDGYKYDKEIKYKFYDILKLAENGKLNHWINTKHGYLAYIILLDQFSRHIYRNSYKAFSNDKIVYSFMIKGFKKYFDKLTAIEKLFAFMPIQHSETINDKIYFYYILVNLIKYENDTDIYKNMLKHLLGHLNVLLNFNRYPTRNHLLNLKNTPSEIIYLKNRNKKFHY